MADGRGGTCLGVVGGSGGAGATSFAAALAASAPAAVLVDLDCIGGGIDVVLGVEKVPGTRWSGLHADGGRIDPAELAGALPRWAGVPVLSCDRAELPVAAVGSVLGAATSLGDVVLDLGRVPAPSREAALRRCGLVVLVVRPTVAGVTAAAAVLRTLTERCCVVLAPDGPLSRRRVAGALGVGAVLALDADRALADRSGAGIDVAGLRRSTRSVAHRVLELAR